MILRKSLLGVLGLILTLSAVVFAQQPQEQAPLGRERLERKERHRARMGRHKDSDGRGGRGRLLRELNLTEAQREQMRAITQRRLEATRAQREELFKLREKRIARTFSAEDETRARQLRDEIRAAMEGMRSESETVLTAEQRARLEELKKEHKTRHEMRMKEREERMKLRQEMLNKQQ
ncbi:MAG TPA: Spy/CpxP family protein refolding chaperone [Pyrinomonadaceae bacterium]|nr:Spy/CpxP family protein refolding chaperone [Pyrinomonadaceae bacterium]